MISRFRVHRDLEFRKSKTGKVSTFDSRSWEPRTHPRTPLSHQNKPERHARLSRWERARQRWEAGSLNCQKRIIKKRLSMHSAMSDLLRQIILINFSLDLNLGAPASLCISFLQITVCHLGYFILSGFPVDLSKSEDSHNRWTIWTAGRAALDHVPYYPFLIWFEEGQHPLSLQ